jgi:hypothetical protein
MRRVLRSPKRVIKLGLIVLTAVAVMGIISLVARSRPAQISALAGRVIVLKSKVERRPIEATSSAVDGLVGQRRT